MGNRGLKVDSALFKIVAFLRNNERGECRVKELVRVVGGLPVSVRVAVFQGTKRGLLVKKRWGVYALAPVTQEEKTDEGVDTVSEEKPHSEPVCVSDDVSEDTQEPEPEPELELVANNVETLFFDTRTEQPTEQESPEQEKKEEVNEQWTQPETQY